jgi:hypothetical protein
MPQLFASNLEYLKKRIHINLNSDLLSNGYNFKYKIKAKDKGLIPKFASSPDSGYYQLSTYLTSLDETPIIIEKFSLSQNYPNPFNPSTKISWQSPLGSHQTLKIYDVLGREVATLVNEYRDAGIYEVEFDGSQLSSGVYYYQLKINDYITTRKMLFLK